MKGQKVYANGHFGQITDSGCDNGEVWWEITWENYSHTPIRYRSLDGIRFVGGIY